MPYMIIDGDPQTVSSIQGHTVQVSNQPSWVPEVLVGELQAIGARVVTPGDDDAPTVVVARKTRAKTAVVES